MEQDSSAIPPMPHFSVIPSPGWRGFVENYFFFSGPAPSLILPTGGVDFLFVRSAKGAMGLPRMLIHGYISTAFMPPPMTLEGIGIRFRAGGFAAVTGIPQTEANGDLFDLADFLRPAVGKKLCQMSFNEGEKLNPLAMELVLEEIAPKSGPGPSWIAEANRPDVRGLDSVTGLARQVGLSTRQLERLSGRYFGVTPKKLLRIQRLRKCLRRRVLGASWTAAALDSGFSDQAHVSRDCRAILGMPPTDFLRVWKKGGVFRL